MFTIDEIKEMSDEEKAALNRKAMLNVAGFIAIKVGIAVAIHYAVKAAFDHRDSKKSTETLNQ